MSSWLAFLHVGAVLAFVMAHGIHATIMWRMRGQPDPETCRSLFNGLPTTRLVRILAVAVIATGLLAGFVTDWWQEWWMWLSLVILLAIWLAMWRWGGSYFGAISETADAAAEAQASGSAELGPALAAFERARLGWQPPVLMAIGIGGLGVIAWLMVFKPF